MTFHRVELGNGLDLFSRFAFVAANNPWRLGEVLHQIAAGFDTARGQTDCGLKGLFHFSSKEETATFLSLRAINAPKPSLIFRILRCQLDCDLGIRDGLLI